MERWTTVEILPINSRKKYCLRGHQIKFWIQTVCSWLYERTCHFLAKRTSALEELLVKEPAEGIWRARSAITRKIMANHLTELEAASSLHINFLKCVGLRLRYTDWRRISRYYTDCCSRNPERRNRRCTMTLDPLALNQPSCCWDLLMLQYIPQEMSPEWLPGSLLLFYGLVATELLPLPPTLKFNLLNTEFIKRNI